MPIHRLEGDQDSYERFQDMYDADLARVAKRMFWEDLEMSSIHL